MTFMTETRAAGSEPSPRVVVGLGANLGNARATLGQAVFALERATGQAPRVSSLYRSAPLGPDQPDFFNAALEIVWSRAPGELLACTQRIENDFGRVRAERWGPRTLDLDVLWWGARVVDTETLTVPHPELTRRAFALLPLLELIPDASDPRSGAPYAALLPSFHSQRIERVAKAGWQFEARASD